MIRRNGDFSRTFLSFIVWVVFRYFLLEVVWKRLCWVCIALFENIVWRMLWVCRIIFITQEDNFLPSATVVAERLCFHRCLFVYRGGVHPQGRHPPPRADILPPWTDTLPPLGRHPPSPSRRLLQRTVQILLECILVLALRLFIALGPEFSADTAQCEGLPCCVIGGSKSLLLVIAFGFLSQFFWEVVKPMNGTLSFYECRLSGGALRGGRNTQTLPVVINFIWAFCTQSWHGH